MPQLQIPQRLSTSLAENKAWLNALFRDCSDLVVHPLTPPIGPEAAVVYMDGLIDESLTSRAIIEPILLSDGITSLRQVASGLTHISETALLSDPERVVNAILQGTVVLLVDGHAEAVEFGVHGWEARAVEAPSTEGVIRGPREGFVETLRTNTSLLRRRVRSPQFKILSRQIGSQTRTLVCVAYLEGTADAKVVAEVFRRLDRIRTNAILDSGYIEEFIQDSAWSPFPQVMATERPDTAAAQVLEGRILILVDGSPFALAVPVVFGQFLQASEDYYERSWVSSTIRLLRYLAMLMTILLPAFYIAVVTFHQGMLPTSLLETISFAREGIPFPAFVEALLMEISFELLREAGVRLPKPVGQAVSIVGALVIGEAAVNAGIVSAPMVIVVAITGIASFTIPRYNAATAIRLMRFPFMVLASTLGVLGITFGLGALLLHLCALESFGIPYLTPLAPLKKARLKDVFVRAPHRTLAKGGS